MGPTQPEEPFEGGSSGQNKAVQKLLLTSKEQERAVRSYDCREVPLPTALMSLEEDPSLSRLHPLVRPPRQSVGTRAEAQAGPAPELGGGRWCSSEHSLRRGTDSPQRWVQAMAYSGRRARGCGAGPGVLEFTEKDSDS